MTATLGRRSGALRLPALLLVLYLSTLGGAAAEGSGPPHLVIRDASLRPLASVSLAEHAHWHLAWNHSVTGNRVRDFYAHRDGTMLLTHSHTPAFDAGLGHLPGRGTVAGDGRHGYWILDLDEPVPANAYWLRVGSAAVDHRLVHPDVVIPLSELAAGQRVRVAVEAGPPDEAGGGG